MKHTLFITLTHEHLDKFALINMNGRVYDSVIGRFLSPDPYIQSPYYAQNYDRYSYVLNNPLKYIDPSGYKHRYHLNLVKRDSPDWVDNRTIDDPFWSNMFEMADRFAEETTGGAGSGAPLGGSAASGPGTGGGGGGTAPLNFGGDGGHGDPPKGNAATVRPHKNYLYKFPSKKTSSSVPANNSAIINDGSGPGFIFSGVNGSATFCVGGMYDVGILRDSYGNKRGYISLGATFGYGQSFGSGVFMTNPYFHYSEMEGWGGGASIYLGIPISLELMGNIDYGAVSDQYWNRFFAGGMNLGAGKSWTLNLTYTWLFDLPTETDRGVDLFINKFYFVPSH